MVTHVTIFAQQDMSQAFFLSNKRLFYIKKMQGKWLQMDANLRFLETDGMLTDCFIRKIGAS